MYLLIFLSLDSVLLGFHFFFSSLQQSLDFIKVIFPNSTTRAPAGIWKRRKRLATYAVAMLCFTSGCFFASTSFLPSSFSMYAMSLSYGLLLFEKYAMAVAVSVVGVILGWPISILAIFTCRYLRLG